MRLEGQHAIITGASRGIGVRVAHALAEAGAHLTLAARSKDELEKVAIDCRARNVEADVVAADLTTDKGRAALVKSAVNASFGAPSILINNAGTELLGSYHRASPTAIEDLIRLNLTAPLLLTRDVLPTMVENRRGHVVNLSSFAGKAGTPFATMYSATKFGLVGATHSLRAEYRGSGVSFSVICPVFVTGAGMFARLGEDRVKVPWIVGTASVERVVKATLRAIEKDQPEIVVGSPLLRPLLAMAALAPKFQATMADRIGVADKFQSFLGDAVGDPDGELNGMDAVWSKERP